MSMGLTPIVVLVLGGVLTCALVTAAVVGIAWAISRERRPPSS